MEGIGSLAAEIAWVPGPGDLRRREVICGLLNWAAVIGRSVTMGRKEGEDIEIRYDVGFSSKGPSFLATWPVGNHWDERKSIDQPRCGISRTPASLDSTMATIATMTTM